MSRSVVITGTGVLSALGDSSEALHAALHEGRTALSSMSGHARVDGRLAGPIEGYDPQTYLGNRNFRPLDRTGRLAVTAAHLALEASGWSPDLLDEHEVGLGLGTMFCGVDTIAAFDMNTITAGPKYAKPMDFANTVINAAAGQTALWHNLRGINSTIASGPASGLEAIGYVADLIRGGRAPAMLAGGAEALSFPVLYTFARTGLLAEASAKPAPLAPGRSGFALGEGACFLMLENEEGAAARSAPVLGSVKGHATGFDGSRGRDPERTAEAMTRTVRSALANAGLAPSDIGCIGLSANGSKYLDGCEARALDAIFGRNQPPATTAKAQLGDCLGAGGALHAVALLECMRQKRLPGVPDLRFDTMLPPVNVSHLSRDLEARHCLIHAFGFDGGFCALILSLHP